MKKPSSFEAFCEMLKGMGHRERFVFNSVEADQNGGTLELEIYSTLIWDKSTLTGGTPHNINVQYVSCGKVVGKSRSKLLTCMGKSYARAIYDAIRD